MGELQTTAKIVSDPGKIALDEAGTRFLGPAVWRYFKTPAATVFNELEEDFPGLFDIDKMGGAEAVSTANQAAKNF